MKTEKDGTPLPSWHQPWLGPTLDSDLPNCVTYWIEEQRVRELCRQDEPRYREMPKTGMECTPTFPSWHPREVGPKGE
jgi:hypothetical protein